MIAFVLAGGAVALLSFWERSDSVRAAPEVIPDQSPEARMQRLIEAIEPKIDALSDRVRPLAERHIEDPRLRAAVLFPFGIAAINESYPHRNKPSARVEHQRGERVGGLNLPDLRNFFYDFLPPDVNQRMGIAGASPDVRVGAAYQAQNRTLFLPEDFNPSSLGYQTSVYHELVHAAQYIEKTIALANNMPGAKEFYQEADALVGGVFLDAEVDAYQKQVEMMNLLMNNELMEKRRRGEVISTQEVTIRLEGRDCGREMYELGVVCANAYFPNRDLRSLHDALKASYLEHGVVVYEYVDGRFLRREPR